MSASPTGGPRDALARGELPFNHNPFETRSPDSPVDLHEWPREASQFLAGEADALHILGNCGMGKTTILMQIRRRLAIDGIQASYACVPVQGRFAVENLEPCPVVLLDETDRLAKRALGRVLRKLREAGCRTALAGHRNQLREIKRAGFSPAFVELRPLASAAEAQRVFDLRVSAAAGGTEHPLKLSPPAAEALLRLSGGNIERCLQIGYEIFEDLDCARPIAPRDVEQAAASLARALGDAEGSQ